MAVLGRIGHAVCLAWSLAAAAAVAEGVDSPSPRRLAPLGRLETPPESTTGVCTVREPTWDLLRPGHRAEKIPLAGPSTPSRVIPAVAHTPGQPATPEGRLDRSVLPAGANAPVTGRDSYDDAGSFSLTGPPMAPRPAPPGVGTESVHQVEPRIEVRQTAPEALRLGKPASIEVSVANRGDVAVDKVLLTCVPEDGLLVVGGSPEPDRNGEALLWPLGRLEPGQVQVVYYTVGVDPESPRPIGSSRATVSYSVETRSEIKLRSPRLEIAVTPDPTATVGEPTTLTIRVANLGDALAEAAVIRGVLPDAFSHPEGPELEYVVGDLAPGQSQEVPLTIEPVEPGQHRTRLTLGADGVDTAEAQATVDVKDFRLALAATGPPVRYVGQTCSYTIRATNEGQSVAHACRVTARLPDGLAFARATGNGRHDVVSDSVSWSLDDLPAGESRELTLTCLADSVGRHTCAVELACRRGAVEKASCKTQIKGISALRVETVDVVDPVEVGRETIYEIRVANQGTLAATGLVVECEIPDHLEAIAADGPTEQSLVAGTLRFEPLASLAPGDEAIYRIKCRALRDGDARLTTRVGSDQLSRPVTEEESTTVYGGLP